MTHHIEGLSGAAVAITGASSGIGAATAALLSDHGVAVVAIDRTPPNNPVALFIEADIGDPDSVAEAAAQLPTGLAGLLNIAGVPGTAGPDNIARINYLGLRALTEAAIPKIRQGGCVVNVASTAGDKWRDNLEAHIGLAAIDGFAEGLAWISHHPYPRERAYSWFKEALIVWTAVRSHSLRATCGIRLCCVSPGPVDTPILDDFRTTFGAERVDEAIRRGGGAGAPSDIAQAILFLASPAARWVVGANMIVDGGVAASHLMDLMQATDPKA